MILIIGALPTTKSETELYQAMISVCKKADSEVSSPLDTVDFKGSDAERYERGINLVRKAKLVIAEASKPSSGQGMEIQEAANNNIPIIVIAKHGSSVSGMIKGCPQVRSVILYKDVEDLKNKLSEAL